MFHFHHSLKVIPAYATQILVIKDEGTWKITQYIWWYHLGHHKRLYHRQEGKLVQYWARGDGMYEEYTGYPISKDARAASVLLEWEGYKIVETYDIPADTWKDVTSQEK